MLRVRRRFPQRKAALAVLYAVAGALLLYSQTGSAQVVHAQTPRANSITGIVTDTLGMPISDVDVYVTQLQRHTRSKNNGTFVIDDVRPGRYEIGARSLGYVAGKYRVTVGVGVGTVHIEMIRYAVALPTMITVVERTGLSGVIGDTTYAAMRNVNVRILGTDKHVESDSTGAFNADVKPGQYMVELTRAGYERQLIGVTIPPSGGRRVAAWMKPQEEKPRALLAANVFEMAQGTIRADPIYSRFFTREDMKKLGITEVRQLASMQAMKPVEERVD